MPFVSPPRALAATACLLGVVAVLAGPSAGSNAKSPRATAPRLIAHDTTGVTVGNRSVFEARRGTSHLRSSALAGPRIYMDTFNDPSVANASSDIGLTQFVVAKNGRFDVYSRTSGIPLLADVTNTGFWSELDGPDAAGLCADHPQGEPSVAYDRAADRWVVSEAAYQAVGSGPYVQCVAVSTSPDATGTWNRYVFQVSTSLYPDRPTLAVWADGYYLSFNQQNASGTWTGAGALALERSKMLAGTTAQSRYFDLENVTPGLGGMLPATISGTNAPTSGAPELYLQAHDDPLDINDRLEVWGFHVDWTAPVTGSTFQPVVNLPLNGGGFSIDTNVADLAQSGSTQMLDPLAQAQAGAQDALPQLGGRLQWGRSSGGDETLTATLTAKGASPAMPVWFKLSDIGGAGWNIVNKAGFAPDTTSRFLPSAAFDNSGEVGLSYVKTDSTIHPTTAYTNASDGAFGETTINAGGAPFTTSTGIYGGSTTLSLDPIDLCTFWFSGPSPGSTGASVSDFFSFPSCVASSTQAPLLTADPTWTTPLVREGLTITGNLATFSGATSTSDQWRRCDTRGLNCVDLAGETSSTHLMTAADASGDHTLRFEELGTNANGTSRAVTTATTLVQSIPPVNLSLPVLSGTAQSGQVLSTTAGSWQSSSPLSYTYRWRRCASGVCANIGGATSATYTLTDSDLGSTVDVVVSATNTGGGTDANAAATAAVAAASASVPPSGGTSGGGTSTPPPSSGGGGGGAGAPDLTVTGTASNAKPAVGDSVLYVVTVADKNRKAASGLFLTLTLSSGLKYVSSAVVRGNGCAVQSPSQVKCNLDWLSGDVPQTDVRIIAQVTGAGTQTLTASALAAQGELNAADNGVTFTLNSSNGATAATQGVPSGLNGDASSPTSTKTKTTKVVDHKKPTARAVKSTGRRGRIAAVRFKIYDDRGFAKAIATIKHKGKKVATRRTGFGPVAFGSTYYVGWKVPKKAAKGVYSFCVVAIDRAGNKSRSSCGRLTVK